MDITHFKTATLDNIAFVRSAFTPVWPIIIAIFAMYAPMYTTLATEVWPVSAYAHGPVVFAIIFWLTYKAACVKTEVADKPQNILGGALIAIALLMFVVGKSQSLNFMIVGSQMPLIAGLVLMFGGFATLKKYIIPILLLFFLIPLPSVLIDSVTAPLKEQVSIIVDNLLYDLGYPIARSGVVLTVGSYQMLIADACSGLNSMYALAALGVVFVHLRSNISLTHKIILLSLILPIAFLVNIIRVLILVLVTYHFGDIAGQQYHDIAAASEFLIALIVMVGADKLISVIGSRIRPEEQTSGWL